MNPLRWFVLLALILACALPVAACAPEGNLSETAPLGPPFRFNITALPTHLHSWVQAAANNWNQGIGRALIIIDPEGPHKIVLAPLGTGRGYAAVDPSGRWTITFDDFVDLRICSVPGTTIGVWTSAAYEHEFGHVLRAFFPDNVDDPVHSLDPDDVMHHQWSCDGITQHDIDAVPW